MNRRFLFAMLLALVLPLAQFAAAAHEVSHVRAQLADKSAPAALHCDVCANAAGLTGGAAAPEPAVFIHAPSPSEHICWQLPDAPDVERIPLFLSRAPPFPR